MPLLPPQAHAPVCHHSRCTPPFNLLGTPCPPPPPAHTLATTFPLPLCVDGRRHGLLPPLTACTARNAYHEGSAKWFIHGNTFQRWKMGTGSLLWIYGKRTLIPSFSSSLELGPQFTAGSGKSILSFSIIEDITKSCEVGLASIAFFYFDFKDESKNTRGALSSLLVQLATQSDAYSEILSDLYLKHDAGSKQPSDDVLRKFLEDMPAIPDQTPIYIVIDALDECTNSTDTPSPREKVLSLVEWLVESHCSNLRLSVTSRTEADIEAILQPLASHKISLHSEAGQKEDITNYIKWFVDSNPKARKWRKQDKKLVIEKLSERADGMFRWVFCQLDRLRRCIVSRIRNALDELPETLDETYERTLLDIDKEHWVYAHRLFQCLVVSLRPLRVEELAEFLTFEFEGGTPIFQADCRPEDPREAVLSTCSSLIAVIDADGSAIVQFSHFTVKEYLTSTRIAEGRVPRYYTPLEPAHFLITRACLSILLQLDDQITEEHMKDFPLVEYAARYWVEHAKFKNTLSQTEDMVKRLFDPRNPHFAAWISIYNMDLYCPLSEYSRPTPLYYAALLNLCGVAEWLVNTRSQNINALGGYHGTPLHAASATGSLEAVQFLLTGGNHVPVTVPGVLLDQGANINVINDDKETPLIVAMNYGPMKTLQEVTNVLLSHGANPNSSGKGQSPTYVALSRGHHDVVLLLQSHGADLNTRDDGGKTLLHVASEMGHLRVAQGLLEFGVAINTRDNQGRTPLHVIQWGSDNVALLLLEHGADPTIRDNAGQTPLHAALRSGSLKFAQRLLERGLDVNLRDNQGRTPLHVIQRGSRDVALLLLERGADPGVQDDDGQTLLHVASQSGNEKFAWRLLEDGFDVKLRDNRGRTPLHVIQRGCEAVALLLLKYGADPGVRDNDGHTPLHVASRLGNLKFAQRLLELGVSVNSHDNQGRTPLHVIEWWNKDVRLGVPLLGVLLESGADQSIRDNDGRTPLHAVAQWGRSKVTQRILELGLDVNWEDERGQTHFDRAGQWCKDFSQLLLGRGADPGVRDNNGQTPLHVASREGNLTVAQQLLKFDVDVNSRDSQGRTPFQIAVEGGHDKVEKLLLEYGTKTP